MKVSEFKSLRNCDKSYKYSRLCTDDNKRPLLMEQAICTMVELLKEHADQMVLQERLSEIIQYEDSWFDNAFQRQTTQSDDLFSLMRFVLWFQTQNIEVLETNVTTTLMSDKMLVASTKDRVLVQNVHLVGQMGDKYVAFIISRKEPDHSPKGRSVQTRTTTQPEILVAKSFLESTYPLIHIGMVHLRSELDEEGNMYPDFMRSDTKKSNLLMADFKDYIEDGTFDMLSYVSKLQEIVDAPTAPNCGVCRYASLCKGKALKGRVAKDTVNSTYVMPEFTAEQQAVVDAVEGSMCVVAGPGSGKTAVLVGRIKNMLDRGIRPEKVLAITYTKKAAAELAERISSFCTTEMPYISTINALCDSILRQNEKVLGKRYKVLTSAAQLKLIENLIKALPKKGFAMRPLYGKFGLLNAVRNALNLLDELGDYESFKASRKLKLKITNFDEFFAFAEVYKQAVDANAYITFDEQVDFTIKLFREHPEILGMYQNLFTYIMVDEYQDVNKANAEFIYLLADRYENLCVVGDDDQNIYGFRGGDPSFMINFPKRFPKAKQFILSMNFRSTDEIVEMSKKFVAGNVRIDKDIKAARGKGIKPLLVSGNDAHVIEEIVAKVVKNGYTYGDIAVLSTVNANLEQLKETLTIPCELAKTYLINDPLFKAVQSVLTLYYKGLENNKAMFYLMSVLYPEDADKVVPDKSRSLYDVLRGSWPDILEEPEFYYGEEENVGYKLLSVIAKAFHVMEVSSDVKSLVANLTELFECSGSEAEKAMVDLLDERCIESKKELAEHFEFMSLTGDDARVELEPSNSVTLITSHESKGKEWPVVILQNGEKYDSDENGRRLIYVASTRAKDALFICHDKSASVNLSGVSLEEMAV